MFERAVEKSNGAIPVEGFTPMMYLDLFTGLEKSDFDDVIAVNGVYEYESGELEFIMYSEQLITSADGTINKEGMGGLLENIKARLDVTVLSEEEVDSLIEMIE
jgi:hypothetical protein